MEQLILHLVGDYITQSDWMAQNKTKNYFAALLHATVYSLPFFLIGSCRAVFVIWITHFLIDRFRLARYVCFVKNKANQPTLKWEDCSATGYHKDTPVWLAVWLMIAADNTIHLAINYLSIKYLRG